MNSTVVRSASVACRHNLTRNPIRDLAHTLPFQTLVLFGLHMLLAVAMRNYPSLATAHALLTVTLGLFWLRRDRRPHRLVYLGAYLTGAELLWRMTYASLFWEFGKYALILIAGLGMLRYRSLHRATKLPVLYFGLLIPSIFVMPEFDREFIAANLAGPLALAVATMFFSSVTLTRAEAERVFLAFLYPVVGAAFLATSATVSAESIEFAMAGNRITSGNWGPNQMSAILGLGAVAAFFYVVGRQQQRVFRIVMIGCLLWLTAQTVLTFGRGGFWSAIAAVVAALFFLLRDRRSLRAVLLAISGALVAGLLVVAPFVEEFTQGAVSQRFADFDVEGRDRIIESDLIAFQENPLVGLGPGFSRSYHANIFRVASAHTEYSRMLSEHGSFGLIALLVLLLMAFRHVARPMPSLSKAYVAALTVWALTYMFHSATRLAAPSFVFALAAATFVADEVSSGGGSSRPACLSVSTRSGQ